VAKGTNNSAPKIMRGEKTAGGKVGGDGSVDKKEKEGRKSRAPPTRFYTRISGERKSSRRFHLFQSLGSRKKKNKTSGEGGKR